MLVKSASLIFSNSYSSGNDDDDDDDDDDVDEDNDDDNVNDGTWFFFFLFIHLLTGISGFEKRGSRCTSKLVHKFYPTLKIMR